MQMGFDRGTEAKSEIRGSIDPDRRKKPKEKGRLVRQNATGRDSLLPETPASKIHATMDRLLALKPRHGKNLFDFCLTLGIPRCFYKQTKFIRKIFRNRQSLPRPMPMNGVGRSASNSRTGIW
jgi:hypothetical protein